MAHSLIKRFLPVLLVSNLIPGLAFAGAWSLGGVPSTGPLGGGVSVPDVQVLFAGDGITNDAQTSLTIPAGFSASVVGANGGGCSTNPPGQITVVSSTGALIPNGPTNFCTITFTVLAATPAGSFDIGTAASPATLCSDSIGNPTPGPCDPINNGTGALIVSAGPQPALSSVPAPASTITINDIVGGGATNGSLTITNSGQAGSTLNIGAPSGLSGVLSITPNTAQTAAQGGPGVAYTISCTAAAVGTTSQVLSFTHDGTSPASPVTYNVDCVGVAGPTAPTASLGAVNQPGAGPINLTATGSVPVNVDTAGVATASLALTCTIPATGASNFQVTAGGTRTINAPATVGNSAPDIGLSCVRQAAAVNATLSCAQNATPDPDPAALTATVTCPAGTVAPNGGSSPAPGGTVTATAVTGTTATGNLLFTNAGGTAPYDVQSCTPSAGFTVVSPTLPATVPANGSLVVAVSCQAPAAGTSFPGTLSCTTSDPNFAAPTYALSCNGVSAVIPAIGDAGKILLAGLVIGLGLLGMGLRRSA